MPVFSLTVLNPDRDAALFYCSLSDIERIVNWGANAVCW